MRGKMIMLHRLEAEVDINGNVRLLEPLQLSKPQRAIVTLFNETNKIPSRKGTVGDFLKFLPENRLPPNSRPSAEEIEAQIIEARESWD
jgi:hypothetical protein